MSWAALFASLLGALFDALARAFVAQRADKDRIAAHEKIGAQDAAIKTQEAIQEIADAQARANARDDSVRDIVDGLRADAAKSDSGK